MAILDIFDDYKDFIILAGFAIGILAILGFLPAEVEFFGLKDKVIYLYVGFIALSVYLFHKNYWGSNAKPSFDRTTSSRNLSNPQHYSQLERERGTTHMPRKPTIPSQQPTQQINPGKEVWDKFRKE
jgi:hypothetical protein